MKVRRCDLCDKLIVETRCADSPVVGKIFGDCNQYDFCEQCLKLVRQAVCMKCWGTDQYKNSPCEDCHKANEIYENRKRS